MGTLTVFEKDIQSLHNATLRGLWYFTNAVLCLLKQDKKFVAYCFVLLCKKIGYIEVGINKFQFL